MAAILGVESPVFKAVGNSRIRGGITTSLGGGFVRVLQAVKAAPLSLFAVTFSAHTIADPVNPAMQVMDFDIPVTRPFVVVRFTADAPFAAPTSADTFEFASYVLPVGKL